MDTVQTPKPVSDADLLCLIGAASDSPEDRIIANDALHELYRRHYGYVLGTILKFSNNLATVELDAELLCCRTFENAFRAATSFQDQSNGDAETAELQVKAWFGRIAANLAKSELRALGRKLAGAELVVLSEETAVAVAAPVEAPDVTPTPRRALVALKEILSELKKEDREILLTYANDGVKKGGGWELPPEVRDDLERRTGYERSNIRQRWTRLTKRLRATLEPFVSTTHHTISHV